MESTDPAGDEALNKTIYRLREELLAEYAAVMVRALQAEGGVQTLDEFEKIQERVMDVLRGRIVL